MPSISTRSLLPKVRQMNKGIQIRLLTSDKKKNSKYWKRRPDGRMQRPIFMAATKQHVGKTSCSLAVISGLQKRFEKVGFIKPVGQQHVPVESANLGRTLRVDKDVCLIREHFQLHHIDYQYLSPVIIPKGYTKDYIDGKISDTGQMKQIFSSFEQINDVSDVMMCEGTGHCAVGSIVGLNNAKVAGLIGADMVLVANGGLGSAFDELELNRVLCQHHGVRLAGVIINKVIPEKYEQTKKYMSEALMNTWGVPLLGCIPDRPFLGCPAIADLEKLFGTQMICGEKARMKHYNVDDANVVTTSLSRFLENLRTKPSRTLYICHVTRNDIILGFLGEYQRRRLRNIPFEAALVICGRKGKYRMNADVAAMMEGIEDAPIIYAQNTCHEALEKIIEFTPKLNIHDTNRVTKAVDHYEPYIDFDELLRRTSSSDSSFDDPCSAPLTELRSM